MADIERRPKAVGLSALGFGDVWRVLHVPVKVKSAWLVQLVALEQDAVEAIVALVVA